MIYMCPLILRTKTKENCMKDNKKVQKEVAQPSLLSVQPVIMELFYRKEGVPGTKIFTGEITAKYTTPSGTPMIELTQVDPETGDWRVFSIRQENIKHVQPKRML